MNLREVPQSSIINPAISNPELFNVGVPLLSSVSVGFGNSGFRFNKLARKRSDDSLAINLDDFVNILGKNNYLNVSASCEILSGGYNWQNWYFNFAWSEKASLQLTYPKSIFGFIAKGNAEFLDETLDFKRSKIKELHYREWAFGAARPINDKWKVGAKVKILFGKSSFYSRKLDASFYTDPDTYHITTKNTIDINRSMPEMFLDDSIKFNYFQYTKGFRNPGLAIDLGAEYKFNDRITFSASLIDLGTIRWKNNLKNFRSENTEWTFKGIDINDYIGEEKDVREERLKNFIDSVVDRFGVEESETRFYTPLTPKLYLAASYIIDEQQTASVLLRNDFFNAAIHTQLSIAYMYKINQFFTAATAYSIAYRNIGNLGLGFVANYGPMQFYITTDNFIGIIAPASVRMTNVRLGFTYLHRKAPAAAPRIN
jgi:hypothetical protein